MDDGIESKIRYLDMIEAVISRMATNSFALKGWAVTLAVAILALADKKANVAYFLIAFVPIVVFWFLDSYYLQLERRYRALYRSSARKSPSEIDFDLDLPELRPAGEPSGDSAGKSNLAGHDKESLFFGACLWSRTEFWFYVPTAGLTAIIAGVSLCLGGH